VSRAGASALDVFRRNGISLAANEQVHAAWLCMPYARSWWQCFSWAELPFLHPFNEGERGNDGNPVRFRLGPQVVIRIATNGHCLPLGRCNLALRQAVVGPVLFSSGIGQKARTW